MVQMRGIPVPIQATELVAEVEAAALDTLRADPYTSVGGLRGVKTVELHYPQGDGGEFEHRSLGRAEKPALSIVVNHDRAENSNAATIRSFFLDIVVLCQAGNANTRTGRTAAAELVGTALSVLVHNIDEKTHTWLASAHPVLVADRDSNAETTGQDPRDNYTFRAQGQIQVEVRVPDVLR